MSDNTPMLSIHGSRLVNKKDETVILRGLGLGGWMNMENFITGYPGNEQAQRQAVRRAVGDRKYRLLFDKFLEYFFSDADARFIASLGLNLLRIPVNYRHFEDDMKPFEIKEEGFRHLDRVIDLCSKHRIYTIIDLHALPGHQNQAWHSDNPIHKALFWKHKHFQDRVVYLWERMADHYKNNPWVAGYNPVNEPADETEAMIVPFYERLYGAIRESDPDHIIFLEGNRYSQDFHMFGEPWEGVIYANHDYALPGFINGGIYPGFTGNTYVDKTVLEEKFLQRSEYMLKYGLPIWVGEFGPVYPQRMPETHEARYRLLEDQLEIYRKYAANWSIWLYKDIGLQGLVFTPEDSRWMRHIAPIIEKKRRLGVDSWGSVDDDIREVMEPIENRIEREFPAYSPFPFGQKWVINRLVRHILLAEPLVEEFGCLFEGLGDTDIDVLMQSFRFENCLQRNRLAALLSSYST